MADSGEVWQQVYHPTKDDHGDLNWKKAIADTVEELRTKAPTPIKAIGLSAPGLPNAQNTCIAYMPGRLQGLEFFEWSKYLGQSVRVLNDAHAATMAELNWGAAKNYKNVLMLTLGTGVGGGVVLNGQLHQGAFQKAGHVGHISIDAYGPRDIVGVPGSIEDAIGNATIKQRSFGKYESTYELLEAYRQHNAFATWLWLDAVQKLAVALCSLINVLSPDVVVLGGGIAQSEDDLFQPLAAFMDHYEWRPDGKPTPIVQAHHGDMAGAIGAAAFAMAGCLANS